jgi:hypothetical protein
MNTKEKTNPNKTARIAGFLYLIYIATTIFASGVNAKLIVFEDTAATVQNIMASEWQFRLSFMSDLLGGVLFLLLAWALYVLLKPVNKNLAFLFVLLNLGGVAVQCMNTLNQFAALVLLSGADYLNVFQADQLQALAMLFLDLHKNGFMIAQIFYGAWLFPLGYLVFKSGFFPRVLGVILMVHCVAWLTTFLQIFLFPDYTAVTYISYPLGFIAEFGLTLWLLIKGVNVEQWEKSALEFAKIS